MGSYFDSNKLARAAGGKLAILAFICALIVPLRAEYDPKVTDVINPDSAQQAYIAKFGDKPIREFRINGLTRTKSFVVEHFFRARPGQPLSSFKPSAVQADLLNQNIFTSVNILFEDSGDGVIVILIIAEKWTIYPVPILIWFRDTKVAGLVIAETNALGYNKGAALGGLISNRGNQAFGSYIDPNLGNTDFFGKATLLFGDVYVENATPAGDIYQSFMTRRRDIQTAAGYTFLRRLSPAWQAAYHGIDVVENYRQNVDTPPERNIWTTGLKLSWIDQVNRFYFDEGFRAILNYNYGLSREVIAGARERYQFFTGEAVYTNQIYRKNTLTLGFYGGLGRLPAVYEHRLGGLDGSRPLPALLVPADNYANWSINYQVPILVYEWGTVTMLSFFDGGVLRRDRQAPVNFYGPGAGIRFYLRNIAVPAFGTDVAYEMRSRSIYFSLAIGYRPSR